MKKYPEQIPESGNRNEFIFSFAEALKASKNLEQDFENIDERIQKIVNEPKFFIGKIPILSYIIELGPTKNELLKISKACERLAQLIEVRSEIMRKLSVANVAREDPDWLYSTFANIYKEIPDDISEVLGISDDQ